MMTPPDDSVIEASRRRLRIPSDWQWFSCSNECGDIVWCPPQVGDIRVAPICSADCMAEFLAKHRRMGGIDG